MMDNRITIRALVSGDRQKVWRYYTEPIHITKWNFATPEWHCPTAFNDLRKGGRYFAHMEARDGSFGFDMEAVYDEVKIGEGFRFTMLDGRVVEARFIDVGGKTTEVVIQFDPETKNPLDLQQQGWQAILDNFKAYTEAT